MSLLGLASALMMLIGFCFAYLQRNSHEGIGVYGVIAGIIGAILFCTEQRKLIVNGPRETEGENEDDIAKE